MSARQEVVAIVQKIPPNPINCYPILLSCHPTFHSNRRLVAADKSLQRPVRRAFSERGSEVIVVARATATCWLDWDWPEPESGPEPEAGPEPELGPEPESGLKPGTEQEGDAGPRGVPKAATC